MAGVWSTRCNPDNSMAHKPHDARDAWPRTSKCKSSKSVMACAEASMACAYLARTRQQWPHGSNGHTAALAAAVSPRCSRDDGRRTSVRRLRTAQQHTLWIYAMSLATRPRGMGIVPPKAGSNQKPFSPLSNWPNLYRICAQPVGGVRTTPASCPT